MSRSIDLEMYTSWEEFERDLDDIETKTGFGVLPEALQSILFDVSAGEIDRLRAKRDDVQAQVETLRKRGRNLRSDVEKTIRAPRRRGEPLPDDATAYRDELRDMKTELEGLISSKEQFITAAEQDQLSDLCTELSDLEAYLDAKTTFDAEVDQLRNWIDSLATDVEATLDTDDLLDKREEQTLVTRLEDLDSQITAVSDELPLEELTAPDRTRLSDLDTKVEKLQERVVTHNESVVTSECETLLEDGVSTADTLAERLAPSRSSGEPLPDPAEDYLRRIDNVTDRIDDLLSGRSAEYVPSKTAERLAAVRDTLDSHREFVTTKGQVDETLADIEDEIETFEDAVRDATDLTDYLTTERRRRFSAEHERFRERLDRLLESVRLDLLAVGDVHKLALLDYQIESSYAALDGYNDRWLDAMKDEYEDELNSYFDGPEAEHTIQQLEAIFRNDNFNRVNAAAGTGKTTTFGRRVYFLLSQFDSVSPSDILAVTFTNTGQREMETELSEQFGIEGVNVVTLNAYGKSVAEDQYDDIRFVVDEARRTDLAMIWRRLITESEWEELYDDFLAAWKESSYDPDNKSEIRQTIKSHERKLSVGILGEDIGRDDLPEETLAHKEITRLLTAYELDYDYRYAVDWDSKSKTEYTLDFRVEDPALDGPLFIEYNPSEATRDGREWYKNPAYESPHQLRRFFDRMSESNPEAADGTLIMLDGSDLLGRPADEIKWESDRVKSNFRSIVREAVETRIADNTTFAPSERGRLTGLNFYEEAYRRYKCERSVVDQVEQFIDQVRVREWSPSETADRVQQYIDENDIEEGVRQFCWLAVEAYRRFARLYDNRHRTDFHGSLVLTRDLLKAGEVADRHTYPHVMVDEMQDLNPVQFDIIRQLARQRDDVRVFGVGDDWQSIFGFRGARPDLFINFGTELGADAFADTRLEANHRCPDTVVDTSNALIRNNDIRTQKDPEGAPEGAPIRVHHLGCDTYPYLVNQTTIEKIVELVEATPYEPGETQILLRQKDGDQAFFNALQDRISGRINPTGGGYVDIRTAHDAKGSEAKHVIIPKVMTRDGYPSVNPDKWVEPVKWPPAVYRESNTNYQIEEERRLFYVALTRAKERVDILTVEGAESRFVDELPEEYCLHNRPLPEHELEEIDQNGEIRKTIRGAVERANGYPPVATLEWDERGLVEVNLFDASDDQQERFIDLEGQSVELSDCGVEYRRRKEDDAEGYRLQLQIDEDTTVQPINR